MDTSPTRIEEPAPPPTAPLAPWKGRLSLLFAAFVVVGLAVGSVLSSPSGPDVSGPVGDAAPDFTADMFDGSTFTLSGHFATDGRPVVLNLFASWCLPCREEIPELSRFATDRADVLVVGVAVQDTWDDALALVGELAPTYPTGFDTAGDVLDRYPTIGLPATFYIDGAGIVRARHDGKLDYAILESMVGR